MTDGVNLELIGTNMIELSVADLAKKVREPTCSVRQQVREKGAINGVPVTAVDDAGRTKVQMSDEAASRLNLAQPKLEQVTREPDPLPEPEPIEKPEPEPEPVEQSKPKPVEQSRPKPVEQSRPKPVEQSTPVPVETKQATIYEPKPTPKPEPKPKRTRQNPSSGGDVFFFGLCAVAALSFEPVRREARDYFMHHDDWTRRF